AVFGEDFVASELRDNRESHVQIQAEITTKGVLFQRAHNHGYFAEQAYKPNGVCKRTRHVSLILSTPLILDPAEKLEQFLRMP
ncbi:MAG: hypothetical protein WAN62_10160, partial [Candidatus Acidiferrum sp.]